MARIAQLLDADRRVVARIPADSDNFVAELLPADLARCMTCRLLDSTGHVIAELPITKGGPDEAIPR